LRGVWAIPNRSYQGFDIDGTEAKTESAQDRINPVRAYIPRMNHGGFTHSPGKKYCLAWRDTTQTVILINQTTKRFSGKEGCAAG
jgi:hypothetical protein